MLFGIFAGIIVLVLTKDPIASLVTGVVICFVMFILSLFVLILTRSPRVFLALLGFGAIWWLIGRDDGRC